MSCVKIGCSGFMYDDWKGTFYPDELSRKQWFNYYCKKFKTVELDVTFYQLPEKETFSKWYSETPEGFTISMRGSRFITHIKKLKSPVEPLDVFFLRAAALKEKLGIVLWQFPPDFKVDLEKLREFIEALSVYKAKNAFEFREKSWINRKVTSLLEKHNMGVCLADWPDFISDLPMTTDFVYIRRHGTDGKCLHCYDSDQLKADAKLINKYLKQGKDVSLYFNNGAFGNAPKNAKTLNSLLKK